MTFDHDEPSAHAQCTRITFEAVVILFLPFLPSAIEARRREGGAGAPPERPCDRDPAPIEHGDGIS
jgi:hypothetical protein